jgi:hypothetical protein
MGWGLLRNITRETILKHLEKRKKAMPMTIRMFGPGFQLTAAWFPEEQAADKQWNTVAQPCTARKRLSIPFRCISIALYCQSNISKIAMLRILQHNPNPGTGNCEMTHENSPTLHKIYLIPIISNTSPITHVLLPMYPVWGSKSTVVWDVMLCSLEEIY